MTTTKKELSYFRLKLEAYWKSHSALTPLAKQDLLLLVTILLPLVKSWCRG